MVGFLLRLAHPPAYVACPYLPSDRSRFGRRPAGLFTAADLKRVGPFRSGGEYGLNDPGAVLFDNQWAMDNKIFQSDGLGSAYGFGASRRHLDKGRGRQQSDPIDLMVIHELEIVQTQRCLKQYLPESR